MPIKSNDFMYLQRSCSLHEHTMRGILDEDGFIWITYETKPELNILKRLLNAIKYLFGNQVLVDEAVWGKEVTLQLHRIIKYLEGGDRNAIKSNY